MRFSGYSMYLVTVRLCLLLGGRSIKSNLKDLIGLGWIWPIQDIAIRLIILVGKFWTCYFFFLHKEKIKKLYTVLA